MFTIEELTAALNNPNSPARMKLLNNLSMSPLDPAAAYQQLVQGPQEDIALPPQAQKPGLADIVEGQAGPQMQGLSMNPLPMEGGAGKGPWSFDYAGQNNGAPMIDPNNPNFVPPAAASAAGMSPTAELMPGETAGMPDAAGGAGALMKMLQGAGGLGKDDDRPLPPPPPVAPRGNNWNPFTAAQFQTPGVAPRISLADLLEGRGRR